MKQNVKRRFCLQEGMDVEGVLFESRKIRRNSGEMSSSSTPRNVSSNLEVSTIMFNRFSSLICMEELLNVC